MWTSSGTNFVFEISVNNNPQNVFFGYMLLSRYELKAHNFCEVALGMQKNGFFKLKKNVVRDQSKNRSILLLPAKHVKDIYKCCKFLQRDKVYHSEPLYIT